MQQGRGESCLVEVCAELAANLAVDAADLVDDERLGEPTRGLLRRFRRQRPDEPAGRRRPFRRARRRWWSRRGLRLLVADALASASRRSSPSSRRVARRRSTRGRLAVAAGRLRRAVVARGAPRAGRPLRRRRRWTSSRPADRFAPADAGLHVLGRREDRARAVQGRPGRLRDLRLRLRGGGDGLTAGAGAAGDEEPRSSPAASPSRRSSPRSAAATTPASATAATTEDRRSRRGGRALELVLDRPGDMLAQEPGRVLDRERTRSAFGARAVLGHVRRLPAGVRCPRSARRSAAVSDRARPSASSECRAHSETLFRHPGFLSCRPAGLRPIPEVASRNNPASDVRARCGSLGQAFGYARGVAEAGASETAAVLRPPDPG